ncbi:unnamed protein product [Polarella glacialis]|uniref:GP-PDE domain-containing protein n=1 Tax=Polarella glacialis TaxID=89957 RepID=A0A813HXP6_POLGL|nr:unnamed protein product [Polarella glacialis]
MPRIIFQSFHRPYLEELRSLQASLPGAQPRLCLLYLCLTPWGMMQELEGPGESFLDGVAVHHLALSARNVAQLRAKGRLVFSWTVDHLDQLQRVAALGVDGVISNRPDLALIVQQQQQQCCGQPGGGGLHVTDNNNNNNNNNNDNPATPKRRRMLGCPVRQ